MADAYAAWVADHGGDKVIRKILIANNGLGAAKAIRSMRRWAFQTFGREDVLHFIAMVVRGRRAPTSSRRSCLAQPPPSCTREVAASGRCGRRCLTGPAAAAAARQTPEDAAANAE